MIRASASCYLLLSVFVANATRAETFFEVSEDALKITIVTPQLEAVIRKKGYVSGVAAGTLKDVKTGFRESRFGLDIVDWIMEPGSDEGYRDQLNPELIYRFNNQYHGKTAKRSIEGPQICTQAKEVGLRLATDARSS